MDHFGTTVPVVELHERADGRGLVALRHDVDHDIDVALEVACLEHERDVRASYYLLPTAGYWNDPALIEKCLQLQDYGHEVGLHLNVLAEWLSGSTDDPDGRLAEQLAQLRDGGVWVRGVAAHGDRLCYEHGVANDWCFAELRPENPSKTEDGRTAEGPRDPARRHRLRYPPDHLVRRPDGATFALWSMSMRAHGLAYHAWHTRFDRYFSDSGGAWTRTPDPLTVSRGDARWQVLMHPIHWRGPPRVYFFLAPARSGSKWLSKVLDAATPLRARHEYILNQPFHRGECPEKPTGADFRELEADAKRVEASLADAWSEIGEMPCDYAEVNVYLERFLPRLRTYFPEASTVHLRRHPADVVRSLMTRDWYDTPEDRAHPPLPGHAAGAPTQFERVCHYVADVDARLAEGCAQSVRLEHLTRDVESLVDALRRIGIVAHPRLAAPWIGTVVNAGSAEGFPPYKQWTGAQKDQFTEICGPSVAALGYSWDYGRAPILRLGRRLLRWIEGRMAPDKPEKTLVSTLDPGVLSRARAVNCAIAVSAAPGRATIRRLERARNAHVTLGGSDWHSALTVDGRESGWATAFGYYVGGRIRGEVRGSGRLGVFGLSYGADGRQLHRRKLGSLDAGRGEMTFAFAPRPDARRFDIALYLSHANAPDEARLRDVVLTMKPHGG